MQSFIDKHVLITGGAEGVGKGFVEEFIKLGATVSIIDIQTEKGMQICKEFNGKCYFFQCDVSSCEMLRETYESIKREVGTIDILINNAAVAVRKPLKEISEEYWEKIHDINTKPSYFLSVLGAEDMKKSGWGRIINITSVRTEFFDDRHSGYSITKAGVESITKCLASEYGDNGITVNMLSLGLVKTAMTEHYWEDPEFRDKAAKLAPVNDTIYPKDVAKVAIFICTDDARFICGEKIHVDGGSFLWKANI